MRDAEELDSGMSRRMAELKGYSSGSSPIPSDVEMESFESETVDREKGDDACLGGTSSADVHDLPKGSVNPKVLDVDEGVRDSQVELVGQRWVVTG